MRLELNMSLLGVVKSAYEGLAGIFGDPRKFDAAYTVKEPPKLTEKGIPAKLMDRVMPTPVAHQGRTLSEDDRREIKKRRKMERLRKKQARR